MTKRGQAITITGTRTTPFLADFRLGKDGPDALNLFSGGCALGRPVETPRCCSDSRWHRPADARPDGSPPRAGNSRPGSVSGNEEPMTLDELLRAQLDELQAMLWTTPHLAREAFHIRELLRLRAESNSECRCKTDCFAVA